MGDTISSITNNLISEFEKKLERANSIDIIVSFVMESGVRLILDDLIKTNVKVRLLTGTYLNITQPHALYLLKSELKDNLDLRFFNEFDKSFHPKSYIIHTDDDSAIFIGSSNLSKGAFTDSIEWNYQFKKSDNEEDFTRFYNEFELLFNKKSIEVTDEVLKYYSKHWVKPKLPVEPVKVGFKPRGPQIEALYELENTREEGYGKALIVAATGIGKTYLAAFDSKGYDRVLFVAHRIEILKQAAQSFKNVYPDKSIGFFYADEKDTEEDFIFALVQSLANNINQFEADDFDYIVVDEFHHAVANSYKKILNHFNPKFLLGLTATPERLDNKDVFALCDYNNVYELRLKDAINQGWLAPFRYYGIYDATVDYNDINMRNGKYDEADLEEKLMINKRASLILNHFKKYKSNCAIGFCSSRNHAEYMAKYFNENGLKAASLYSGEQGKYSITRSKAISKLQNKDLDILFTVDMFNEGVDIPELDLALFLRPTQSPIIFLQQLGRGLRKFEGKSYLTVLDFIGNYKKANLVPLLISSEDYSPSYFLRHSPMDLEYPQDCIIDFDFELIDIFKKQAQNEMKIKDRIKLDYLSIKEDLGHRPSRMDLFLRMDEEVIKYMKSHAKVNLFRDYLGFLKDNEELNSEEEIFIESKAHEFLNILEQTHMTKSYKMPIFKAFYNNGNIKMAISEDDVFESMKEFYSYKSNGVDMLKDNSSKDYESWAKEDYVKLAVRNPIKFLKKTNGDYFIEKEGYLLALNPDLEEFINLDSFKHHFGDIIEYRTMSYYKDRFGREHNIN